MSKKSIITGSKVVSEPNASIKVIEYNLSNKTKKALSGITSDMLDFNDKEVSPEEHLSELFVDWLIAKDRSREEIVTRLTKLFNLQTRDVGDKITVERKQVYSYDGHLCWEGTLEEFSNLEPFTCPDLDCRERFLTKEDLEEQSAVYSRIINK